MSFFLTVVIENCEIKKKNNVFFKTHRALKILLTSALSKSNNLRIILHTVDNTMVEIDPLLSIAHNVDDFLDIMMYLVEKMKLKASDDRVLAKVIRSKVDDHLEPNTFRYRLSTKGRKFSTNDIENNLNATYTVFINIDNNNNTKECGEKEELVRLSNYELSTDTSCARLINIFESAMKLY